MSADGGVFRIVNGKREWVFNPPVSAREDACGVDGLERDSEERARGATREDGGTAKGGRAYREEG